jgi:hypothetical protein
LSPEYIYTGIVLNPKSKGEEPMNSPVKKWFKVALCSMILIGAGTVFASDPLDGAKDFSAIGVGQFTPGACNGSKFTMSGTLRGEPVGNAQYTLTVGSSGGCQAGGGAITGALVVTASDGSVLALDVAVSSPDGGETFVGTFSAPNNLSGSSGANITSAFSSGKFASVFGSGLISVGSGLNTNVFPPTAQNSGTLHLNGTLVYPK